MEAFVAAGAGFLLAVLWFDLMHDVQARGHDDDRDLPEPVLGSIAAYYARVTTAASPMNRLVAVAMVATLIAIVVEIVAGLDPTWLAWVSLVAAIAPISVAAARTVPNAVQLGTRVDDLPAQSRLARSIPRDHLFAFAAVAVVVALQLASAAR